MSWNKISKGRIQRETAGFFIIKPENSVKPVPFFCPLCKSVMKNAQDVHYYRKWSACYDCSTMYAEPNREKWHEGWRPDLSIARE